jgi:hypothetical protein
MTRFRRVEVTSWLAAARGFVAEPASARPLATLRIGIAGVLMVQALLIARDLVDFCGSMGIIQGPLNDYFTGYALRGLPHVRWVADFLSSFGVAEDTSLRLIFVAYLIALGCLLFGFRTRLAAAVAWFCHSMLLNTGYFFMYGVNRFAEVSLFYLIWIPAGHALSLDVWAGRVREEATPWARLGLRVLQIHLCIAYLAAGLAKAWGIQWWTGEAIWRAVMLPQFHHLELGWLAFLPWCAAIAGYGTLVLEIGYCIFIWPRATRRFWVVSVVLMHAGIALFLGLATFSAVMITLTVAAFGVSPDPLPETSRSASLRRPLGQAVTSAG